MKTIGLAVGATLLTLGVLELAVRMRPVATLELAKEARKYGFLVVWDDEGEYFRHVPGARAMLQGVEVAFNALGMRDDEPRPKLPGSFRLLVLGDSIAFGPGVPFQLTWAARLRTSLAAAGVDDVVIAAVPGWNTVQEARFLARHIDELQPTLILLMYVQNDAEHLDSYAAAHQPAVHWWTSLYRTLVLSSRLFEWASWTWARYAGSTDTAALRRLAAWHAEEAAAGPPFAPGHRGWLESRAALERIATLARERGAGLVLFMWNMLPTPITAAALARLEEFGSEARVPVFDTAAFFAEVPRRETLSNVVFLDPHPNAAGHALAAAGIERTLREAGLLPRAR